MMKIAFTVFCAVAFAFASVARSQALPVNITPGGSEGEVEVTISSTTPVTILPAYSQTTTGIRNVLYPNVAWSSFVGFALTPISAQPNHYSITVVNLLTNQIIDESGMLSVTLSFSLPE